MKGTPVTQERLAKLREIVGRQDARLLSLISDVGTDGLSRSGRDSIRDALTKELTERGLGDNDEPNPWGLEVESLIDMLGYE